MPEDYGAIDMIAVFATITNLTVALEISQGIARFYPEAKSEADRIAYASSGLWFTLGAFGVFALFASIFSDSLTLLLIDSLKWQHVIRLAIIAIVLNSIFSFLQNLLRWQLKVKNYVISNIVFTLVTAAVAGFLVVVMKVGIAGVFYGQIAGAAAGGGMSCLFTRKSLKPVFVWNKCKEMLSFSLPLVPSGIGVFVAHYVDRIAIKHLMTMSDVGLYGIGFRFAAVVSLLMVGFNSALTPLIYSNYKKASTPGDLSRIFRYFLAAAIPMVATLSLFSHEILRIFATPRYYSAWKVIPILSVSSLLFTMYIFAPGLDILKRTRIVALIHVAAALSNTFLNLTLIPVMGIAGSALATLISASLTFSLYMVLSQRYYPVPHKWLNLLGAVTVGLVVCLAGLILPSNIESAYPVTILKSMFLVVGAFFVIWILLGSGEIKLVVNRILKVAPTWNGDIRK
ncbi:MAG: oligosaccharide flippase family protein [Armatimonadetes bacterium]|nr:oligosaccharide flippase family protein [Armatimonadota bacterium]